MNSAPMPALVLSATLAAMAAKERVTVRPPDTGEYDLFVSVGLRDGTPQLALPLPDGDGQRRYKLGRIRLSPP